MAPRISPTNTPLEEREARYLAREQFCQFELIAFNQRLADKKSACFGVFSPPLTQLHTALTTYLRTSSVCLPLCCPTGLLRQRRNLFRATQISNVWNPSSRPWGISSTNLKTNFGRALLTNDQDITVGAGSPRKISQKCYLSKSKSIMGTEADLLKSEEKSTRSKS